MTINRSSRPFILSLGALLLAIIGDIPSGETVHMTLQIGLKQATHDPTN